MAARAFFDKVQEGGFCSTSVPNIVPRGKHQQPVHLHRHWGRLLSLDQDEASCSLLRAMDFCPKCSERYS
jgi:hypothetical protein